jgi:hypothetical protein
LISVTDLFRPNRLLSSVRVRPPVAERSALSTSSAVMSPKTSPKNQPRGGFAVRPNRQGSASSVRLRLGTNCRGARTRAPGASSALMPEKLQRRIVRGDRQPDAGSLRATSRSSCSPFPRAADNARNVLPWTWPFALLRIDDLQTRLDCLLPHTSRSKRSTKTYECVVLPAVKNLAVW